MNENKKVHVFNTQIHERHLDVFGHVNNAVYLELYELARWDLITKGGFGLKEIQEKKQGPVILEVNVKFIKELKNREQISIETNSMGYEKKIGILKQKILNDKNQICSEAEFKFGFFDLTRRALILPSDEWIKAITIY